MIREKRVLDELLQNGEKTEFYDRQCEIIELLSKYEIKLKAMIDSKIPIDMMAADFGMDVEAMKNFIDNYNGIYVQGQDNINHYRNVLKSIQELKSTNTVGINYLNNELQAESNIGREQRLIESRQKELMESVVVSHLLCDMSRENRGFNDDRISIMALEGLGYEGDFGAYEGQKKILDELEQLKRQNKSLENENKSLRREVDELRSDVTTLRDDKAELTEENSSLKDENKKLKEQVKDVVKKAKEYKDFVLQTIRDMPVIGKLVTKKIEKSDKALNEGPGGR